MKIRKRADIAVHLYGFWAVASSSRLAKSTIPLPPIAMPLSVCCVHSLAADAGSAALGCDPLVTIQ